MKNDIDKSQLKVFVAMSGGVDSSVSAALLKEEGYQVHGIFMKNWSGDDFGIQSDCPWEQDQKDAEAVCKMLEIPFRSINFEKEYRARVVSYFFDEISKGRTPNPDVMCNKEIKFGLFLERALELGADLIATGHYAQVIYNSDSAEYELHKGIDSNKDQTYFLNMITQEQLSKTLFPIGKYKKSKVRELAHKYSIPVADKPDSQGICFIGEINVKEFLRANLDMHEGDTVDIDTQQQVGTHDGYEFYTIGQREGLGIGGVKEPYYVVSKDKDTNIIFVAQGKKNKHLYTNEVFFSQLHQISKNIHTNKVQASIRYRQAPQPGSLDLENNSILFDESVRAAAAGQSIVFYDGSKCIGSAIIEETPH